MMPARSPILLRAALSAGERPNGMAPDSALVTFSTDVEDGHNRAHVAIEMTPG